MHLLIIRMKHPKALWKVISPQTQNEDTKEYDSSSCPYVLDIEIR